jgi:hypothetical protein
MQRSGFSGLRATTRAIRILLYLGFLFILLEGAAFLLARLPSTRPRLFSDGVAFVQRLHGAEGLYRQFLAERYAADYPDARTAILGIVNDDVFRMLNSYRPVYFPHTAGMFAFQPHMRDGVQRANQQPRSGTLRGVLRARASGIPRGLATLAERLEAHPQHARVEVDTAVTVTRRQDQVVEMVDHGTAPRRRVSRFTWVRACRSSTPLQERPSRPGW